VFKKKSGKRSTALSAVLRSTREELKRQRAAAEEGSDAYKAISNQIGQLDTILESNATKFINTRQAQKALREVSVELASTQRQSPDLDQDFLIRGCLISAGDNALYLYQQEVPFIL
jgi:hypothetical protein